MRIFNENVNSFSECKQQCLPGIGKKHKRYIQRLVILMETNI